MCFFLCQKALGTSEQTLSSNVFWKLSIFYCNNLLEICSAIFLYLTSCWRKLRCLTLAWIKFKASSISVFEANLNFTFYPNGSVVIPSCSTRKGYKALVKGKPRITLSVMFLLLEVIALHPLWYQSHSFLAGDSVVVFSVSPSVSAWNFGAQLLCPLLTVVGATLVVKWIPRTKL